MLIDRTEGQKFGRWKSPKKGEHSGTRLWRCNNRPKDPNKQCKKVVVQEGIKIKITPITNQHNNNTSIFTGLGVTELGIHNPHCTPKPDLYDQIDIYKKAKREGLKNKGLSARFIAQPLQFDQFSRNRRMHLVKTAALAQV